MSDREIILHLRSNLEKEQELAFVHLYGLLYTKSVAYIRKNNGTVDDARDIFQDALLAFYKLIRQDRLSQDTKAEAYIFSILRNLWLKKLQKNKRETGLDEKLHDRIIDPEQLTNLIVKEQHELLDKALDLLGPNCRKILTAFYYDQLSMEEIRQAMKLSNIQVTKNKKYKCLKKLKEMILGTDYFRHKF